jgi:hypothetical protein
MFNYDLCVHVDLMIMIMIMMSIKSWYGLFFHRVINQTVYCLDADADNCYSER